MAQWSSGIKLALYYIFYFLFNNLFVSKNITYKYAIQMTLEVLTKRNTKGSN